ncbi:MAG: hypothetical protein HQK49_08125 [Oligoflexia bacterium]|nr:hypothetical protein [Oligoflexia bacterium]
MKSDAPQLVGPKVRQNIYWPLLYLIQTHEIYTSDGPKYLKLSSEQMIDNLIQQIISIK